MAPQGTLPFVPQVSGPAPGSAPGPAPGPAAIPPPGVRYKHLGHHIQDELLGYLDRWDYLSLVDRFEQLDRERGPNYAKSRINSKRWSDIWKTKAMTILLRTPREILRAAIKGELPYRAAGTTPGHQRIRIRTAAGARPSTERDIVIYINWLADISGNGLTQNEFERLLQTLEQAVASPQGVVGRRIDQMFNDRQAGNAARVGLMQGCSERERTKVTGFVKFHRDVTFDRIRRDGTIQRIMIPAEVGLTVNWYTRAREHSSLSKSSPWMFRLVSCALDDQFPGRFKMHQFVLFDVVAADELGIGESIASHLLSSYDQYGGFNFDQAALTSTKAYKVSDSGRWLDIAEYAVRQGGYFRLADPNIEDFKTAVQRRHHAATTTLAAIDIEKKCDDAQRKLDERNAQFIIELDNFSDVLTEAEDFLARHEQAKKRDLDVQNAMRDLIARLGGLDATGRE